MIEENLDGRNIENRWKRCRTGISAGSSVMLRKCRYHLMVTLPGTANINVINHGRKNFGQQLILEFLYCVVVKSFENFRAGLFAVKRERAV